jgi:hypothetical protein
MHHTVPFSGPNVAENADTDQTRGLIRARAEALVKALKFIVEHRPQSEPATSNTRGGEAYFPTDKPVKLSACSTDSCQ